MAESRMQGSGRGYGNPTGGSRSQIGGREPGAGGVGKGGPRSVRVELGVWGRGKGRVRCAAGRRPDGWGPRCPRAGGRLGGRCGARRSPPPGGRAGGGAGRGQRRISALSIRLLRLALASAPAPSDVRATWPAPRLRPESLAAAAAAAARRAPQAAPAPCPPAARAPPPNPRGGRRPCCPYCCSASSGRRKRDQEPVSSRRRAPLFPPGPRACAPGAAAGGGGAGATWTAREQRKAPPARPSGRPHLWGAQRRSPLAQGSGFRCPGLFTWAVLWRTPDSAPGGRGAAAWDTLHSRTRWAHATASAGFGDAETAGHRSWAGAHAVGALGAGPERGPPGWRDEPREEGGAGGGRSGLLARGPGSPGTRLSAGRRRRPPPAGPRARGSAESSPLAALRTVPGHAAPG